jgi:RHS repeat-associated protein
MKIKYFLTVVCCLIIATVSAQTEKVGEIAGQFAVSPTGAATYTIPIEVPPGINGMQPQVSLVYNSQSGNGIAGWGCNIGGVSVITRVPKTIYHDETAKGITYNTDDAFALDGQRLMLVSGTAGQNGAVYCPESDPFTTVTIKRTSPDIWFEVKQTNGLTYSYVHQQIVRDVINAWYLQKISDSFGNYTTYSYSASDNFIYLANILYGTNGSLNLQNKIIFEYETRTDIMNFKIKDAAGSVTKRLKSITSQTGNSVFRKYELQYANSDHFSRLNKITVKNGAGEALKPTTLNWSYLPNYQMFIPNVSRFSLYSGSDKPVAASQPCYVAIDMTGDGLTDIVEIGSTATKMYGYLHRAKMVGDSLTFTKGISFDVPVSFASSKEIWKSSFEGLDQFDFNGDGRNDIFIPSVDAKLNSAQFCIRGLAVVSVPLQGEKEKPYTGAYPVENTSTLPVYAAADINNNGKSELVYWKDNTCNIIFHSSDVLNNNKDNIVPNMNRTTITLSSLDVKKMFLSDFNGDGLADMLVFYSNGYTVFWNQGGSFGQIFSNSKKTSGGSSSTVRDVELIRMGDFNGDGLADLLMNSANDGKWYFALNQGNGGFLYTLAVDMKNGYKTEYKDTDRYSCLINDFNSDGKSDVWICAKFPSGYNQQQYSNLYRSTGSLLEPANDYFGSSYDTEDCQHLIGDFDGDGLEEFINYGYSQTGIDWTKDKAWRLYNQQNMQYVVVTAATGKITSITTGMGDTTSISYASLAGDSSFYTQGGDVANYNKVVQNRIVPLHAVKSVTSASGEKVNYKYSGLKIHLEGLGFIGMTAQTATNTTTGVTVESGTEEWLTPTSTPYYTYFAPYRIYTKTISGGKTAITKTTYATPKKYYNSLPLRRAHPLLPATIESQDFDGNSTKTLYEYDPYIAFSNIIKERIEYSSSNMYEQTDYQDYISAGGVRQPKTVKFSQKHADNAADFTKTSTFDYDLTTGSVTKKTEDGVTTEYKYDDVGNVLSETVSAQGVPTFASHTRYDATKRFPTGKYTVPASTVLAFTYDTWGNVVTEIDSTNTAGILTTRHYYNAWGQKDSTAYADGNKTFYSVAWETEDNSKGKYYTSSKTTGQPYVKHWYDQLGRETCVESVGEKNLFILTRNTYNAKGQLQSVENRKGYFVALTEYSYDGRGRILNETKSSLSQTGKYQAQTVDYEYDNRKVTTVLNKNTDFARTSTKTFDAWGNVKTSTDPAGITVNYYYNSNGKPDSVRSAGSTVRFTYYANGLQKTIKDPDAGTVTYEYDALGRIKKQTDALGNLTETFYDALGRVDYEMIGSKKTKYSYVTSGNGKTRIRSIESNLHTLYYSYDKYGRVISKGYEINIPPSTSAFNDLWYYYTYDSAGRLKTIKYPSNLTATREYDEYGNLERVSVGQQEIWRLVSVTGFSRESLLGGKYVDTIICNRYGIMGYRLIKNKADNAKLEEFDYNFNERTGNLFEQYRLGYNRDYYKYDNLDRLTEITNGSFGNMYMEYEQNGNIKKKTGLGNCYYSDSSHPHAMTSADSLRYKLTTNQTVRYNAFNKVDSISENGYRYSISYGPDRQRWLTKLVNGNTTRTTYYAGDFESVYDGKTVHDYTYIYGGDGLAAVYDGTTYYTAVTDHLGSIVKLADKNGNVKYNPAYDAWGNFRAENNSIGFHRGYCGHEHLKEFGLINMNGRMYDPLLARFLSPDPYVQAPDFSQSFNRYSYCLNNPFRYNDPDGEFWHIVIGAAIGGTINWIANGAEFSWEGLSYFGVGAAGGALSALSPGAAMWISAGVSASNSVLQQGYASNWQEVSGEQAFFAGIMGAGMSYLGGQMGQMIGADKWFSGISNPLLRETLTNVTTNASVGTVMGGALAELDDDPETTFWSGAWGGFKMGVVTGTITGIGQAAQYSIDNKTNFFTGKSNVTPSQTTINLQQRPEGIPDNWIERPSNKGGGIIYQDPNNPHNSVRVMPGNPNSPNPAQQKPYVIYKHNGVTYDVNGLPLPNSSMPNAHIPYELFNFNRYSK